jgi:hypothetical protein
VAAQAWFYPALTVGTGGGTSALFDRPLWQRNVSANQHADHRLTPDVAAVADRFTGVKIAAAVGGMVGAALWFQLWRSISRQRRRLCAAILATGFLTLVCGYAALGLTDVAPMGQGLHLGLYVAVMAVVVLGLRLTLQLTLLHEHHETEYPDEPVLCPQCDHVVPDMAFCPSCGSAAQASSRSSRAPRRRNRPAPNESQSEGP